MTGAMFRAMLLTLWNDRGALVMGVEERFDIHTAVNGRELVGRSDAGGDQTLGHRVGHANQVVAAPGGVLFAAAKKRARCHALVFVERRTVNRMHDGGHVERVRRDAAEHAPLRTVGVHHVGLEFTQNLLD